MYYILYEHPENGPVWERVDGEDATHQRVYDLTTGLDLDPEDVLVFDEDDEMDHKAALST